MLSAAEWGRPPVVLNQIGPVAAVYAHHSVTDRTQDLAAACRTLNAIALDRGFTCISYSFVIDQHGQVAEGRGWRAEGAHTFGQNSTSYGFVFVGNYETDRPSPAQLDAFADLVAAGVRAGHIVDPVVIRGHRDSPGASTACPGQNLYAALPDLRARVQRALNPEEDEMTEADFKRIREIVRAEIVLALDDERVGPRFKTIRDAIARVEKAVGR